MPDLNELAEAWGVADRYTGHRGQEVTPHENSIRGVLGSMGAHERGPDPGSVMVVSQDDAASLPAGATLVFESGDEAAVGDLVRDGIPLGYHRIVQPEGERRLVVGPGRCHLPPELRAWGWEFELFALRSAASWGMGDLGDLKRAARWAAGAGARVALLTPLHAVNPGRPQQRSPYFPSSRLFRNPLYLRIEDVPGASRSPEVAEAAAAGRALNDERRIDRDAVYALKLRALEALSGDALDEQRLRAYVDEQGHALRDFATFMTLHEHHRGPWSAWPAEHRHPRSPAVARFAADHDRRILFHCWLQYLLDEQLESAAEELGLIHDLAIGVDPTGADAWIWQDCIAEGVSIGAPADDYNPAGQDWGLAAFDPWKLRAAAYEPFIATLRRSLTFGRGLRLDHVMGLWRLFWIPSGAAPSDGTYVRYPSRDLLEILALESKRAGAFVVGEDLGTVEPEVRDEMARRSMLGYRLLWFEDGPPARYPQDALASITNHDLPTIPGMWSGADPAAQRHMGLEVDDDFVAAINRQIVQHAGVSAEASTEEAVEAAYAALATAPSALVVAMIEDAIGVEERQNHPGTLDQWPNWSLALPLSLEDIERHPGTARIASTLTGR